MNIEIITMPNLKKHREQSEFCINELCRMCDEYYGYKVDKENIVRNEYGKPYFKDNESLHFNISHSGQKAVIVIDHKPCGVDIEKLKEPRFNVARRFFTENECEYIENSMDETEKWERFFEIWTAKESYTKMLGCGLTMRMDSFDVLDENIKNKLKYYKEDDYIICVCRD